jgi:flagellar hook-associated protein 2
MGFAPLTFSGVSSFSQDFQTILTRAVKIASLPLQQLQNTDSDTISRKALLGTMQTAVGDLASAISSLGTVGATGGLGASSSDPSRVAVALSGATATGSYSISNITSLASAASELSTSGYADPAATPVSLNGSMELVIGNHAPYDFTLSNNSLNGLRDQINSLNAGVSASIITTDAGSFLTVTSKSTGATTLSLTDDPGTGTHQNVPWLTNTNQGSNASFLLNGKQVTRSANTISDAVPGVTITLLGTTASTQPITLSLTSDRTQLSTGLQNLVTKYNAAVDEMDKHVGPAADLLLADQSVLGVQSIMRQISGYRGTGTGSINSLMDLGISLDRTGKMTFDTSAFSSLPDSSIAGAFAYLGSSTSGFGGLSSQLTSYSDPTTGLINIEQNGLQQADQRLQKQISDMTDRINVMQTALQARLQAADAMLAQLDSQQQMLTASLQSLSVSTFGKQQGN